MICKVFLFGLKPALSPRLKCIEINSIRYGDRFHNKKKVNYYDY